MAPFFHWKRSWATLVAFTLVNLWIDSMAIEAVLTGQPLPGHDEPHHTLVGALMVGVLVALPAVLPGLRSVGWMVGAFFGAVSHIFLDALVHPEMQPFEPVILGNPLYLGAMLQVSVALMPLTIWLIVQCVSAALGFVRTRQAQHRQQVDQRSP
jgi:membrane-bound metal-dependent hydrolase YbcI (DUF457 family)